MEPWATKELARAHWRDAVDLEDDVLGLLLEVATDQVAAYAPALLAGAPVPPRYALATIFQARELNAAASRGESDLIGVAGDGYALRSRPLTGAVKQLLRPQQGLPVIG